MFLKLALIKHKLICNFWLSVTVITMGTLTRKNDFVLVEQDGLVFKKLKKAAWKRPPTLLSVVNSNGISQNSTVFSNNNCDLQNSVVSKPSPATSTSSPAITKLFGALISRQVNEENISSMVTKIGKPDNVTAGSQELLEKVECFVSQATSASKINPELELPKVSETIFKVPELGLQRPVAGCVKNTQSWLQETAGNGLKDRERSGLKHTDREGREGTVEDKGEDASKRDRQKEGGEGMVEIGEDRNPKDLKLQLTDGSPYSKRVMWRKMLTDICKSELANLDGDIKDRRAVSMILKNWIKLILPLLLCCDDGPSGQTNKTVGEQQGENGKGESQGGQKERDLRQLSKEVDMLRNLKDQYEAENKKWEYWLDRSNWGVEQEGEQALVVSTKPTVASFHVENKYDSGVSATINEVKTMMDFQMDEIESFLTNLQEACDHADTLSRNISQNFHNNSFLGLVRLTPRTLLRGLGKSAT